MIETLKPNPTVWIKIRWLFIIEVKRKGCLGLLQKDRKQIIWIMLFLIFTEFNSDIGGKDCIYFTSYDLIRKDSVWRKAPEYATKKWRIFI